MKQLISCRSSSVTVCCGTGDKGLAQPLSSLLEISIFREEEAECCPCPSHTEWAPYTISLCATPRWNGSNHSDTPKEGALTPPFLPPLQRTRDIQGDLEVLVRKWWKKRMSQNQSFFSLCLLPSSTRGVCMATGLAEDWYPLNCTEAICFVRDQPWLVRGDVQSFSCWNQTVHYRSTPAIF